MSLAEMPDKTDWLMKPVLLGMCSYESLKSGDLDLNDLARMNDAITIRAENDRRFAKAGK